MPNLYGWIPRIKHLPHHRDELLGYTVSTIDSPHPRSPGPHWQLLGELELPVEVNTDNTIHAWLTEVLDPLNLSADLLNRILKSAQDAATRVWQAEPGMELEHIHLIIFVPPDHTSTGQTWGFFRIEKIENTVEGKAAHDHAIEFYLYVDGQ